MKTTTFVTFLFLISMFPLSTYTQVPLASEVSQAVTVEEVHRFMDEYKVRLMKMDLDAFMALFSKEAVENRVLPYADIREGCGKAFANSDAIQYRLEIYSIQPYQNSAFVRGRYELVQSIKGGENKIFRGDIQWNLVRENGSLKIKEINYGRNLE